MPSFVLAVESSELGQYLRIVVPALLSCGSRREPARSDRRVRVESLALGLVGELLDELARGHQWVLGRRKLLDELSPTFEELGQLVDA